MHKKNRLKAVLAIAIALVFVMPVAAFANFGTIGIISNDENTVDINNIEKLVATDTYGDNFSPLILTSTVDPLSTWAKIVPFMVVATTFDNIEVSNVTLWYRYSSDGTDWTEWTSYGTDEEEPWRWGFTGIDGYYEFYSIAVDEQGNVEDPPDVADASTGIDTTDPVTTPTLDPKNPDGENGWYIITVTITLSATDELSGIESTWYQIDSDFWKFYTVPFPVNDNGEHTVQYHSVDRAGNREDTKSVGFNIDKAHPSTTYDFRGVIGKDGWFVTDVTVTFSAKDIASEVNCTKYRINEGEWEVYDAPFVVAEDGDHILSYYSVDLAGNTEPTREVAFKIDHDTLPPVTTHEFDGITGDNGWFVTNVTVTLSAEDISSEVNYTKYNINEGEWKAYDAPFIVTDDGDHILYYYSVDLAGNTEPTREVAFKIDKTLPVTEHEFDGVIGEDGWFVTDVIVNLNSDDKTSGINYTKYRINEGEWEGYDAPFVVAEDGDHILYYYSVDLAGNTEPTREVAFKIDHDTLPPVTTHEFDGITGDNGWFISDVLVTLSAVDLSPSGINHTYYKLDEGEWTKYTGPFYVTEDAVHILHYYSVDKVGHEEVENEVGFNIDQTDPTIEFTWDGENSKLVADVDDETSGIARVEFYVNGKYVGEATALPYEWEAKPKKGDKGQAIVYDNAGNNAISKELNAVSQSQSQDTSIGWTFLAGWISDVEEAENIITAQAIRLRYIEIAPTGITVGFVKMKAVEFSSHNLLGRRTLRSFGQMSPVIGIFKGGIIIEDE